MLTLLVGFVPCWLLMVRRPEDLGLVPPTEPRPHRHRRYGGADPRPRAKLFAAARRSAPPHSGSCCSIPYWSTRCRPGSACTRRRSDRARHRPDHRGDDRQHVFIDVSGGQHRLRIDAATVLPIRYPLAVIGTILAAATLLMLAIATPLQAFIAAALFGFGVGGILTLFTTRLGRLFRPRPF